MQASASVCAKGFREGSRVSGLGGLVGLGGVGGFIVFVFFGGVC